MNKTEFFNNYGGALYQVAYDDSEYGDFLILHPEEISSAKELQERGYTIVSVFETEDGEDFIDLENPCDYGTQPYKIGYFAINESNSELL